MKYALTIACAAFLLLNGCAPTKRTISLGDTLASAVIDHNGEPATANHALNTDYLLLYFSAHWCAPCRGFTPKLVEYYNKNLGGQLFQVLFVSNDRSDREMQAYMKEAAMPWPAVIYHSEAKKTLEKVYSGQGIPRLVLLDRSGSVVADSFKGQTYLGPNHVLEELDSLLNERKQDPAGITETTGQILPTPDKFKRRYRIDGFGSGANGSMAFINGKVTLESEELETGVVVETITDKYVEISFEGNRYRLQPE
jgi:thiol-disulfide isomerase/thioredoxin